MSDMLCDFHIYIIHCFNLRMVLSVVTFLYYLIEYYQTLIVIAIISLLIHWARQVKNLPPGPWGIPIFGVMPFVREPLYLSLTQLSEKYGNVMSFYLGNVLIIVLSDYNAIKEAFVKQGVLFSGKPPNNPSRVSKSDAGLVVNDGEMASQHRRFIVSTFKDLGMGKSSLESHIMNEIKCFLKELEKTNNQPIDVKFPLGLSVANNVTLLEYGDRFEYSSPFLQSVVTTVFEIIKYMKSTILRTFLPWTQYIPFIDTITGYNYLRKSQKLVLDQLQRTFKEKEDSYTEGSRAHYMDAYITERKRIIEKTGSEGFFSVQALLSNSSNLYGAGIETSSTYILWSIIYMLKYPEVRGKIQHEIDEVTGKERDPNMADKVHMPYTEATLLELHRICSILPISLAHSNNEDANLFGYHIPKRSCILANLWAVHHDLKLWDKPNEFKPERFLDKYGKVQKPEYLIPFSIGKRNCIGEALADTITFLYFVSLFQHFNIQLPKESTACFESTFGVVRQPKPFKVCFLPR